MEERQIFRGATPTSTLPLITPNARGCSPYNLAPGGILSMPNGDVYTLTAPAAFRPACTAVTQPIIMANGGTAVSLDEVADNISVTDLPTQDPFYASTFPQCYALAATTVVAYTLVIMLFITPRSFLDGGVVVLGRRGFTNGGSGGTNIGGRPWLQKVAALTVAISLTIATSNTFKVAEEQYSGGYQNANDLQTTVLGGTELKVIRIISDTFLWLAQAQTLIRLFPRQREKIIIKWTAFALITLDLIFQCLNSFQYMNQGNTTPKRFTDAVPALSYLFQLTLGVLYAAWVIYYSLMKKRYAFYHPQMRNMILVSVLSLLAILVPVVFFVLDISKPDFTGWGDYVRWVGAAAASVIVWEWVERIEALEREEKKDGILGREVFDGDEMLDMTPSDFNWPRRRKAKSESDKDDDGESASGSRTLVPSSSGRRSGRTGYVWPAVSSIASRYGRSSSRPRTGAQETTTPAQPQPVQPSNHDRIRFLQPPLWPARPAPAATPVSRTDTASAASTVYSVRYQPMTETSGPTPPPLQQPSLSRSNSGASTHHSEGPAHTATENSVVAPTADPAAAPSGNRWRALAQGIPFPRVGRHDESAARTADKPRKTPKQQCHNDEGNRWDLRGRLEDFAVTQAEKLRERIRPTVDTASLPVTVVPAPPRRGTALARLLEEEQEQDSDAAPRDDEQQSRRTGTGPSTASRSRTGRSGTPSSSSGNGSRGPPAPPVTVIPAPARRSPFADDEE